MLVQACAARLMVSSASGFAIDSTVTVEFRLWRDVAFDLTPIKVGTFYGLCARCGQLSNVPLSGVANFGRLTAVNATVDRKR